jgi:catechol 2,3-dioxygenase-like lactoylglutathione lyase family enzyme
MADPYPRAITHVGITVPNIEQALRWYQEVLGFHVLVGPVNLAADNSHFGMIAKDVFGPRFRKGRLALLTGSNGVCIEVFDFEEPATEIRTEGVEYWKTGIFHIALIDPNIEELVRRIAESGGKSRSRIWQLSSTKPYKMAYCEDPFGNILEIYSHSTEQTWSNV